MDAVRWKGSDGKIYSGFQDGVKLLPGKLRLIDQTLLPEKLEYVETDNLEEIYSFIKRLVVRGAPAIGCAAALGLAAVSQKSSAADTKTFMDEVSSSADYLASSRPTAVNLFWALNRCVELLKSSKLKSPDEMKELLIREALEILSEDIEMCRAIGLNGACLIKDDTRILTHCNAGALATADYGTALSPIYVAHEKGLRLKVFADETRPLLQGARLTAWELDRAGVDVTVICDNMAAFVMRKKMVDIVITGADRIAMNGDSANKIGTYGLAVLASYHKIPFYIAAPYSTIDFSITDGSQIPIEERDRDEVIRGFWKLTAPASVNVFNPAFDVTPCELISGIITERGIIIPPFIENIENLYRK